VVARENRRIGLSSRRQFMVATAAAVMLAGTPRVQARKRGATLRFVPHADLNILDPLWTTSYASRNHGYMIYDTLFAMDANRRIRPQMVERYSVGDGQRHYSFVLRDGLRFHDGHPVTAEDCVVSLRRWGKRDALGKLLLAATDVIDVVDRKTFRLKLKEPFGLVLEALGKPSSNVPFVLPARIAATSENDQIKEAIGSGPYKFIKDEWQPGYQVMYERCPDYVPRNEMPSGAAGGKRVYVDRVVWRYLADPATAGAALETGEVDYWEYPPADFAARLETNSMLSVFVPDPYGAQGWLRPNHLHPPFNDAKARQALAWMVDQEAFLRAAIGQPKYYRTCPGYFMCGSASYESSIGALPKQDLGRARQLMKDSAYDGRPVVLLDPTDYPFLHAATLVTRELLSQIGVNVDLQTMDWGTLTARRAKKDPPLQGGWNLFNTAATSSDVSTPAVNAGIDGTCDTAWFGWYCSKKMEKLRSEWVRTAENGVRKRLTEQIQDVAYDEVPYIPWGQILQPCVSRRNVHGILEFPAPLLWNISLDT